jgi:signal peptidase II
VIERLKIRQLGGYLILIVFILDRLSKYWMVDKFDLAANGPIHVLPFMEFTLVWNRGIALGLFQAGSDGGRYLLIFLTSAVTVGLMVWLMRATQKHLYIALGLVIGGSIGNIWDRFEYGAVADFVHFFAGGYSFYVFNVADSAITLGVIILLWDALLSPQKEPK